LLTAIDGSIRSGACCNIGRLELLTLQQTGHFARSQETPLARLQPTQTQRTDRNSCQLVYRVPNRLQHAAHLLVAALAQLHLYRGGVPSTIRADDPHLGGRGLLPEQRHAVAQLLQGGIIRHTAHIGQVQLRHPVAGVRHGVRKGAVVGEEQHTLGLRI
jgi:hypothetical protein